MKPYTPKTKTELIAFVDNPNICLGDIDTSLITDMSRLFAPDCCARRTDFTGIESWDTSHVTTMNSMFYCNHLFNAPINKWDVSSVKDMHAMFFEAENFNEHLDAWDVSSVTDMSEMFSKAKSFNQPIGSWDVMQNPSFFAVAYKFSAGTSLEEGPWH